MDVRGEDLLLIRKVRFAPTGATHFLVNNRDAANRRVILKKRGDDWEKSYTLFYYNEKYGCIIILYQYNTAFENLSSMIEIFAFFIFILMMIDDK